MEEVAIMVAGALLGAVAWVLIIALVWWLFL
jgi:hypothetical protein